MELITQAVQIYTADIFWGIKYRREVWNRLPAGLKVASEGTEAIFVPHGRLPRRVQMRQECSTVQRIILDHLSLISASV